MSTEDGLLSFTKDIADTVVDRLARMTHENSVRLSNIRSVFIAGSYVRGDWLEHCSDLDVGVVFAPGRGEVAETSFGLRYISDAEDEPGFRLIQATIQEAVADRVFYSQLPGGIDLMAYPEVPTDLTYVLQQKGPPAFNVFIFDFKENHRIIFGDDFSTELPQPPPFSEVLSKSLEVAETRMRELDDSPEGCRRATYLCWRLIQKSQVFYGELTLDKTRLLSLYREHVPAFASRNVGEFIIRQYLSTYLPLHEPLFLGRSVLSQFHSDLTEMLRTTLTKIG